MIRMTISRGGWGSGGRPSNSVVLHLYYPRLSEHVVSTFSVDWLCSYSNAGLVADSAAISLVFERHQMKSGFPAGSSAYKQSFLCNIANTALAIPPNTVLVIPTNTALAQPIQY